MDNLGKNREILKRGLEKLGIYLEKDRLEQMLEYAEMLYSWNQRFNLTGFKTIEEILVDAVLNSLTVFSTPLFEENIEHLVDVGSGGGVPAIPIKIFYPQLHLTLVESNAKKSRFLEEVAKNLSLDRVQVVRERGEKIAHESAFREKFDLSTARALGSLAINLELTIPFLKVGGLALYYKGKEVKEEIEKSKRALSILSVEVEEIWEVEIPFRERKNFLVIVRKKESTPSSFPRRIGIPQKRPL